MRLGNTLLGALGLFALVLVGSQLRCADVDQTWMDDTPVNTDMKGGNGDGGNSDLGDDGVHCFPGTPTSELQLFNHCTMADHVDRPSHIPAKTWDPQTPLPYM